MDSISLLRTDEEMTELYNKHADTVYRVALMITRERAEAEDVTQSVFVKLMTSGKRFDSDEHIKAWLIVAARNAGLDLAKSWWRTKRTELDSTPEASYQPDTPERGVWEKVAALPEKQKLPVYLYYYEGYKTEEIAKLLGVSHATIRTRLRAARKKLRLMLEEDM